MECVLDWPAVGRCPICWLACRQSGAERVGEAEERFAVACFRADELLGQPAGCRYFLNWVDDSPREEMRRGLIEEIDRVLAERRHARTHCDECGTALRPCEYLPEEAYYGCACRS
jgi:hypothetical protein